MLSPTTLMFLVMGVLVGMLVGVIPGLGPSAGLAILLPLTFGLDPMHAIILLAAVYYGAFYGSTITSVLINTPGDAASVPAALEGYPMARRGRAAPALIIATIASFVAGTVAAILLTLAAPAAAAVTSSFGPPELFLLVILGLLTLIVLVGKNWVRGALSVILGFAIGTVGIDIGGGAQRYTFGSTELINGIPFIPVAIGLFGLGEILWSLYNGVHRKKQERVEFNLRSNFWPNRKEWREARGPIGRGSPMGFLLGVVPGAGATVASLISYSVEKSLSKTPEKFNKEGAVAGIAGPESANNAAATGAMVPLLTMGIPGSASTAVLLGGFLMWGLQPGPLLMEQNPDFAWGLIASMYLGNVVLLAVNIFCIPMFASVTRISLPTLAPLIVVLCAFGAFTVNGSVIEVGIMFACGFVGFFMRMYGLSPAALVIALVLGPLAEETLRQTMIISGGNFDIFLVRTPSLILLAVGVGLCLLPVATPWVKRVAARALERKNRGEESTPSAQS
ncbi:tripartite tricarboxylate transporter permease [Spiractinospora alimapuensis]|uniref:tripartite tricarboxylate transporter permease n=1 Tax=Spiractinospora alimapuensis TaxID=2820884 RepID=UPI001F455ECE|nr:tripartite tricarboxylate transporter permease [Spiractinospora alimapuensis]QVQ52640.1 tripartite tricarboxylate transporter permease [Spiractinospora alimapuensis]